jgi:hypothetical protein
MEMYIFLSVVALGIFGIILYNRVQKKKKPNYTYDGVATTYTNCHKVTFDAKYGFDITATWEECFDGQKMSKLVPTGTSLTVCCKKNSANGGPMTIGEDC